MLLELYRFQTFLTKCFLRFNLFLLHGLLKIDCFGQCIWKCLLCALCQLFQLFLPSVFFWNQPFSVAWTMENRLLETVSLKIPVACVASAFFSFFLAFLTNFFFGMSLFLLHELWKLDCLWQCLRKFLLRALHQLFSAFFFSFFYLVFI